MIEEERRGGGKEGRERGSRAWDVREREGWRRSRERSLDRTFCLF